jgi:hypothetical protein
LEVALKRRIERSAIRRYVEIEHGNYPEWGLVHRDRVVNVEGICGVLRRLEELASGCARRGGCDKNRAAE